MVKRRDFRIDDEDTGPQTLQLWLMGQPWPPQRIDLHLGFLVELLQLVLDILL